MDSLDVSPDGKTIVFDFLGDIYSIPISGGSATQLTSGMQFDAQPRYSPDGTQIIFISDESGGENVWTLNLGDNEKKQITKGNDNRYQGPEWTPDGKYMIASRREVMDHTNMAISCRWRLWRSDGQRAKCTADARRCLQHR